jgi:hypothetical protein
MNVTEGNNGSVNSGAPMLPSIIIFNTREVYLPNVSIPVILKL